MTDDELIEEGRAQYGDGTLHNHSLSDVGNANLLVAMFAHRLRYCPDSGHWLRWNGERWRGSVDDSEAVTAARAAIEAWVADKDSHKAEVRHKMRSRSHRAINAAVALAQRDPGMRVGLDQLDARPYELNTPSGVVELKTGQLLPHAPEYWHTKMTRAGYDPYAVPRRWLGFLHDTFQGNDELIPYMQRLAGLAAIGEVLHHVLPFLFGGGSNGKSVLVDVLTAVLGDYAITAPANFLLAGRDKHETEIARLHGARMVACSEINADSKFDEAKVKVLTGGDMITGRFMRQDFFDFKPSHTLFLMGNHHPQVTGGGHSFWRRMHEIPFHNRVPDDQKNVNLAAELIANEGDAILGWIVMGAQQAINIGLNPPAVVIEATAEYADDTKSTEELFLDECCQFGPTVRDIAAAEAVYHSYRAWAQGRGVGIPLTQQQFGTRMRELGVPKATRSSSGKRYRMKVYTERLPGPPQQTRSRHSQVCTDRQGLRR